ncbi:MAG: nitroreductase family protein [Spirochaetales bacterium]|nr:nitroreductase family protein [Spirochaetales bacterium]
MSFLQLVRRRQSVRRYLDRPVEPDKLDRCLEAARLAPSASNAQDWAFVVVDHPELKSAVARQTIAPLRSFNTFTDQAPVLVVVLSEKPALVTRTLWRAFGRDYGLIDIGIAAEHFCLQAAEEGLGTCMLGWFDGKKIKSLLGIPSGPRVDLVIAVGYPEDPAPVSKRRKPLDRIVSYNRYGGVPGAGSRGRRRYAFDDSQHSL